MVKNPAQVRQNIFKKAGICLLCGTSDNLSFHHLKTRIVRSKEEREKYNIYLLKGEEGVVICRKCHDQIEILKDMRIYDKLRNFRTKFRKGEFYNGTFIREEITDMMNSINNITEDEDDRTY